MKRAMGRLFAFAMSRSNQPDVGSSQTETAASVGEVNDSLEDHYPTIWATCWRQQASAAV